MKLKIRRSNNEDLNKIYELHIKCFNLGDQWYKNYIIQYLKTSFVIENDETQELFGVLLQGPIIAFNSDEEFEPINKNGHISNRLFNKLKLKPNIKYSLGKFYILFN